MSQLSTKISNFKEGFESEAPKEVLEVMNTVSQALIESGIADNSLKTNDKSIDFSLKSHTGQTIQLEELLTKGKVVLSFYRGGWCPYCNLELASLQQVLPAMEKAGATLIAVSPETPDYASLTHDKNDLGFDILFDEGNKVAEQYGLEFELDERLRPIYLKFGLDVAAHNGEDTFKLPMPATYVINQDGTVAYHFVDADYHKRLEPAEILKQL
ncbi:MAG: AhpC/TSA family protein [Kangiellaceae bacterium]|nr:AhpC/TSA family protein [Kangiellaceae bacterium]